MCTKYKYFQTHFLLRKLTIRIYKTALTSWAIYYILINLTIMHTMASGGHLMRGSKDCVYLKLINILSSGSQKFQCMTQFCLFTTLSLNSLSANIGSSSKVDSGNDIHWLQKALHVGM